MTLFDLFCYLREQFLQMRAKKDKEGMERLSITFSLLSDVAESRCDGNTVALIDHFLDSIRDFFMETEWKSYIPTTEEIKASLEDDVLIKGR